MKITSTFIAWQFIPIFKEKALHSSLWILRKTTPDKTDTLPFGWIPLAKTRAIKNSMNHADTKNWTISFFQTRANIRFIAMNWCFDNPASLGKTVNSAYLAALENVPEF